MKEPRWLKVDEIIVAHERQLARFGGAAGIRDHGAIESALHPPRNRWLSGNSGFVELAAAYAHGLAKNCPVVDGNKRVSFIAMVSFLRLNGIRFAPPQNESTAIILALAASEVDEAGLARWIASHMP